MLSKYRRFFDQLLIQWSRLVSGFRSMILFTMVEFSRETRSNSRRRFSRFRLIDRFTHPQASLISQKEISPFREIVIVIIDATSRAHNIRHLLQEDAIVSLDSRRTFFLELDPNEITGGFCWSVRRIPAVFSVSCADACMFEADEYRSWDEHRVPKESHRQSRVHRRFSDSPLTNFLDRLK